MTFLAISIYTRCSPLVLYIVDRLSTSFCTYKGVDKKLPAAQKPPWPGAETMVMLHVYRYVYQVCDSFASQSAIKAG